MKQVVSISKSKFKPQMLAYLRQVEESKTPIIITHVGKPVVKIVPIKKKKDPFEKLRGSVIFYKDPTEPVGVEDWEALK